jgi:hypothetical protein
VDSFQERVARIGLGVAGQFGFALAGGHAVQVHGLNQRPTEDVDLFTPEDGGPGRAVELVVAAYRAAGLMVEMERVSDTFVRLQVADPAGGASKVELAVDWRAPAPVVLDIGPVLHVEDAVAGKMSALFNRFEPRDFIDVDAILRSGRFIERPCCPSQRTMTRGSIPRSSPSHSPNCVASTTMSSRHMGSSRRRLPRCEAALSTGNAN